MIKGNFQRDKYGTYFINLDYKDLLCVLHNCKCDKNGQITLVIDGEIKLHHKNYEDNDDKF